MDSQELELVKLLDNHKKALINESCANIFASKSINDKNADEHYRLAIFYEEIALIDLKEYYKNMLSQMVVNIIYWQIKRKNLEAARLLIKQSQEMELSDIAIEKIKVLLNDLLIL